MCIRKGRGKSAAVEGKAFSVETYSRIDLSILNNFYYCFLIALKLEIFDNSFSSSSGKKKFMKRWLRIARTESLFPELVHPEIDWLLNQVLFKDSCADTIENNVSRIYFGSLKMLDEKSR